jgi:hypothetical protein
MLREDSPQPAWNNARETLKVKKDLSGADPKY